MLVHWSFGMALAAAFLGVSGGALLIMKSSKAPADKENSFTKSDNSMDAIGGEGFGGFAEYLSPPQTFPLDAIREKGFYCRARKS